MFKQDISNREFSSEKDVSKSVPVMSTTQSVRLESTTQSVQPYVTSAEFVVVVNDLKKSLEDGFKEINDKLDFFDTKIINIEEFLKSGNEEAEDDGAGSGNEEEEDVGAGSGNEEAEDVGAGSGKEETEDVGAGNGQEEAEDVGGGSGQEIAEDVGVGSGKEDAEDVEGAKEDDSQQAEDEL